MMTCSHAGMELIEKKEVCIGLMKSQEGIKTKGCGQDDQVERGTVQVQI